MMYTPWEWLTQVQQETIRNQWGPRFPQLREDLGGRKWREDDNYGWVWTWC